MKANPMKKQQAFLALFFLMTTGLHAWESVGVIVYSTTQSNYSRFMDMALKKALSLPLRRREIRMERRSLDTLSELEIGNSEKIILLFHTRDLNNGIQDFIETYGEDPRVFIWITGDPSAAGSPGVDAITAASDNWNENKQAIADFLVPFVLGSK